MAGVNNRGKYNILDLVRGAALPTNFYIGLASAAIDPDDNTVGDIAEVPAGNGYTAGGISLTPGATDFDVLTQDDVNDRAFMQIKDITWTGSGGQLPSTGSATHCFLSGDGGTVSTRELWFFWSLGGSYDVSDGQDLTLIDLEIRLNN